MIDNDLKWYHDNGFPQGVIDTVKDITRNVENFYGLEFDRCFISNSIENGQEDYSSIWLFTKEDAVECKNFLVRQDVDIARIKGNVKYVNLIFEKFKLNNEPTADSSMNMVIFLADDIKCYFNAAGANCSKLLEIANIFLNEYKASRSRGY